VKPVGGSRRKELGFMQQMNMNLPSGATDTRQLVNQLNGLLSEDQPEIEVVKTAVRGLIEIVARHEAALREIDRRMTATRQQLGRM
jgi:hypothetical protein